MTIDDIKTIIANDEHRTLELKKTTGELKDGMHSACAMLNTEGGWLADGTIVMVFPISKTIVADFGTDFGTDFGIKHADQLTDRQRIILDKLFANGSETAKSISVQLGLTQRSIEKDLSFLHKNGFIEKTTKSNNSPWRVLKR